MSRSKKVIRNIIILVSMFLIFLLQPLFYLSPLSAHEHSERSIHYGPSKVVHVEDFDGGKYILCKYDKWVSCNSVNRQLFFFWRFGSQVTGFENERTKAVEYTWGASYEDCKLYGIINDDRVKKIQITLRSGKVLTQTEFHDDLFLFTWKSDNNEDIYSMNIKAYDADGKIIFEEKR